ncbi:ATP-binding protein [Streptomyces sp. 7N604]|uniref:ATP-binding protein n=1 Tax=Streptomyces sp. 7N604 TaxID=3457415 RepID=UPI003FD31CB3
MDRRNAFQLPALRTSAAEARRRVLAQLREWGANGETLDGAELVISELFTNAVCHTDSDTIGCELQLVGALLTVEVVDEGWASTAPHPGPGDLDGEGGRGLLLVDALSEAWGVRPAAGGCGHVVWAELRYGPANDR